MSMQDDRSPDDELTRRYHEANAQDMGRPGAQVRLRVQQHAQAALEARQQATPSRPVTANTAHEAANQPRWKISMLAGIALAGITGLLVLQFDRGTQEEKEVAFGQPAATARVTTPQSAPATPAPKVALPTPATPATPATRVAPIRAPTATQKAAPAASPPATRKQSSESRADTATDASAAPSQGSLGPKRDRSAEREASPVPSPFPASPPAAAAQAPAMAAPAPAAAMAPPHLQRSESLAAPRARAATGFAESITLLQAAAAGRTADIQRLQQQGAPINGTDDVGRTPLMLAVINGHEAAVRQLLGLGANLDLVDREGLTALAHARRRGLAGIAALLEPAR